MLALILAIIAIILLFYYSENPATFFSKGIPPESTPLQLSFLASLSYLLLLLFYLAFTMAKTSWKRIQKVIIDLASLIGLSIIYFSARYLMTSTYPFWNTVFTPLAFYATSFVLGSGSLLLLISKEGSYSSQRALAGISALFLAFLLVLIPLFLNSLEGLGTIGQKAENLLINELSWIFFGRILLILIALGASLRALFVIRSTQTRCYALWWPMSIALVSALVAEVGGRYLFFALSGLIDNPII